MAHEFIILHSSEFRIKNSELKNTRFKGSTIVPEFFILHSSEFRIKNSEFRTLVSKLRLLSNTHS